MDEAPNIDVWEVDFGFLQQRPDSGNPEGGRHGWGPFSDRGRMPSPKIPVTSTWLERFVEEGAFFGYFLCTSKESNSPKGESSSLFGGCSRRPKMDKDQVRFALTGEVLSFAGPKESTQRKRPSS